MAKHQYLIPLIFVAAIYLFESFLVFSKKREFFPFSSFPMYAGLNIETPLVLMSGYVVFENAEEKRIESVIQLRPKYEYRERFKMQSIWKNKALKKEDEENIVNFANIFIEDLKGNKVTGVKKIIFKAEYWNNFSAKDRNQADDSVVLYEHNTNF
jgi:hypothetical protein